jgi:Zn-finger protein
MLKEDCGGNFVYGESGIKDCSGCIIPHSKGGYEFIMSKMDMVIENGRKEK